MTAAHPLRAGTERRARIIDITERRRAQVDDDDRTALLLAAGGAIRLDDDDRPRWSAARIKGLRRLARLVTFSALLVAVIMLWAVV